jgi:protein gp37
VPEKLTEPFHWPGPRTVFVNSMSDLFQPEVPDGYIEHVVRIMVEADWHTYQVLTKRSERLKQMLCGKLKFAADKSHIWWGVSVEDRRYGIPRVNHLRATPATVKFLSIEPLLEHLEDKKLNSLEEPVPVTFVGFGEETYDTLDARVRYPSE